MQQVAQQDYLHLQIADVQSPTDAEKAEIKKHVAQGTIWDVLIETGDGAKVRVLYDDGAAIGFVNPANDENLSISYSE